MFSANLHKDRKKMSLALNSTEIAWTYFTAVDSLPDLEPGVNVLASRVTMGRRTGRRRPHIHLSLRQRMRQASQQRHLHAAVIKSKTRHDWLICTETEALSGGVSGQGQ